MDINSIFDGAKFGDRFVTTNAITLIYHCANVKEDGEVFYQLIDEFNTDFIFCLDSGKCINQGKHNNDYCVIYNKETIK